VFSLEYYFALKPFSIVYEETTMTALARKYQIRHDVIYKLAYTAVE
jgi:hypothetical protein